MFPGDDCPVCKKKLCCSKEKIAGAILIGSKSTTNVSTVSKQRNMWRATSSFSLIGFVFAGLFGSSSGRRYRKELHVCEYEAFTKKDPATSSSLGFRV